MPRQNTSSPDKFKKRFFEWFDGFMVLKFVHFAREHFYGEVSVHEAALTLLHLMGYSTKDQKNDARSLLGTYRSIERSSKFQKAE